MQPGYWQSEQLVRKFLTGKVRKDGSPLENHSLRLGRKFRTLKLLLLKYGFEPDDVVNGGYFHDLGEEGPADRTAGGGMLSFEFKRLKTIIEEIDNTFGNKVVCIVAEVSPPWTNPEDIKGPPLAQGPEEILEEKKKKYAEFESRIPGWSREALLIELADFVDNLDGGVLYSKTPAARAVHEYRMISQIYTRLYKEGLQELADAIMSPEAYRLIKHKKEPDLALSTGS